MNTGVKKLVDILIQEWMQSQYAEWRKPELGMDKQQALSYYLEIPPNNNTTTKKHGGILATAAKIPPYWFKMGKPVCTAMRRIVSNTFRVNQAFHRRTCCIGRSRSNQNRKAGKLHLLPLRLLH